MEKCGLVGQMQKHALFEVTLWERSVQNTLMMLYHFQDGLSVYEVCLCEGERDGVITVHSGGT